MLGERGLGDDDLIPTRNGASKDERNSDEPHGLRLPTEVAPRIEVRYLQLALRAAEGLELVVLLVDELEVAGWLLLFLGFLLAGGGAQGGEGSLALSGLRLFLVIGGGLIFLFVGLVLGRVVLVFDLPLFNRLEGSLIGGILEGLLVLL